MAKSFAGNFHFLFNLFMIILYAMLGAYFLFVLRFEAISATNTKLIGGVLLLYAAYRSWRLIRENKKN